MQKLCKIFVTISKQLEHWFGFALTAPCPDKRTCVISRNSKGASPQRILPHAGVVELVDALDSKSSIRKDVRVRVSPPAFAFAKEPVHEII